ncbi:MULTISPECIES: type II toxin-antitoxin system RelE/ParE family toxin [unclassified Variovorax]|uniref:type II toxin-antitoxin system RelE/ParE family toxin n=1 Tax=unclassified Variovorax TaxID=663243 RepID=UPI003ECE3657
MKRAKLRPLAEQDLVEIAQYYVREGDRALGERFFDTALAALEPIQRMPALGSPRLGKLCDIPRLRAWRVTGFPVQWFYFEADDHLDVVRLVGERQDIAAILRGELGEQ